MKDNRSALAKITGVLGGVAGRVIVIALLVLLTFEGLKFCFDFGHAVFYQTPAEAAPGTDHEVSLDENATMKSVAELLNEEGIIRNEAAFVIQGMLYQIHIYPGDYMLNTSMTTKEILTALNTDPEEYEEQRRAAEEEAQALKELREAEVIGGGSDLVDAEQAAAAAEAGIEVAAEDGTSAAAENEGESVSESETPEA